MTQYSAASIRKFVRGPVLCPGDPGYDSARTLPNAMIDRRPAIIARCLGAADVIACVRFACEHDFLVSVRGGGHSIAGKSVCEAGLMIDLSLMKGICVDPACNDDSNGTVQSRVRFDATAGTTYHFMVSSLYRVSPADLTLNLLQAPPAFTFSPTVAQFG
jgi:FAD/FMN-containing dehydrogenase